MFSCYFLYLFMCVPCSQSSKIYFISFSLVSLVKVKLEINLAENINEALYNHWSLLRENCAAIWYQINKRKNSTISTLKYWNNVENTKETIFCDHFSHLNQIVFHLHKNFWFLLNILVKTFAPSVRSSFLLSNDTVKYLLENISPCISSPLAHTRGTVKNCKNDFTALILNYYYNEAAADVFNIIINIRHWSFCKIFTPNL